jgi:glycosyltransferase involved in cell wall biosynthesis
MFSVVIPVHDKPHTIMRTIESVLAQSFGGFELILVGDPGDESLAAAAGVPDRRIRIHHRANIGPGPARNAGIEASVHDWIAFLDADDLWLPGHLAELDAIRGLHPDCGLIGTAFLETDADGRFTAPGDREGVIARVHYFEAFVRRRHMLCASSAAIHRRVYDKAGGFGSWRLGQDSEYWARIALDFPVAVSTRVTCVYVRGTGGLSDSSGDRWASSELTSPADVCPSIGMLIERYPHLETRRLRGAVRDYIRRHFDWCLRTSASMRDFRTMRRIRGIYWGRPSLKHVALIAIAHLPEPLANAACRFGLGVRALSGGKRRSPDGV